MLVGAVGACARVGKLASDFGMNVEAFVSVSAFREEFALFGRVMELALLGAAFTIGPMFAADHALITPHSDRLLLLEMVWIGTQLMRSFSILFISGTWSS